MFKVQFCQPEDFVYVSVTWVSLHPGNNSRMNLKFSYYAEEYMSVSGSTYAQQAYRKLDSLTFQTLISKRQNSGWVFWILRFTQTPFMAI